MPSTSLKSRVDEDQWIWESFRYHSRTFSLATYLLPRSVQMPVAILYLYCRRVDSIADQRVLEVGPDRALKELHEIRDRLEKTLGGSPPDNSVLWKRLAEVNREYSLPNQPLHELIEGALWDLRDRPIESKEDLISYSNLVGGSVGAMMLPFLAERQRHESLETAARHLGIAMQITNIVRDVGEDLQRLGRVYLPSRWLEQHDISLEALESTEIPEGYPRLIEKTMTTAEQHYEESFDGISALPLWPRTGIRAAARMYREILNEVRANHYDNLNQRAYVSSQRKLSLVFLDGYQRRRKRLTPPD